MSLADMGVITWNVEGKKALTETSTYMPMWDILLFQEASADFDSEGHQLIFCPSSWRHTAMIIHRQHAGAAVCWDDTGPFPIAALRTSDGVCFFLSVYLPHIRSSTGSWTETFDDIRRCIRVEVPASATMMIAGYINMEKLGATAARELPTTTVSEETEELPCVEAVLDWLTERGLRIAVPQGGSGPTHFPYNARAPARCLDYFIASKSLRSNISEVHRETEICTASSHIPLSMRFTWGAEQEDPKKHFVRRQWPGWRPTFWILVRGTAWRQSSRTFREREGYQAQKSLAG